MSQAEQSSNDAIERAKAEIEAKIKEASTMVDELKGIMKNNTLLVQERETELNYIDQKKAFIPKIADLEFFANELYKKLINKNFSEINTRPKLIIGNLGTTHHSEDKFNISLDISSKWRENLKKFYFVS